MLDLLLQGKELGALDHLRVCSRELPGSPLAFFLMPLP